MEANIERPHEKWITTHCVVHDVTEPNGARIIGVPLTPKVVTVKDAEQELERVLLTHGDAYICTYRTDPRIYRGSVES